MPADRPPFRLLNPAQFALLTVEEKTDYLARLTADVQRYVTEFHEGNKRVVQWLLHKDDPTGRGRK